MPRAYASIVLPAPVDRVWSVVREFGGLPAWHPGLAESTLVEGHDGQVGAVRRIVAADGGVVVERLVALDDEDRRLSYVIVESPFAVRRYVATLRVAPVTTPSAGPASGSGETFAEWWAEYDAEAADEDGLTRLFAAGVFAAGLRGLRHHLAG
ncbi:SRPBCC family protein [Nocardioides marmoraquaticus]